VAYLAQYSTEKKTVKHLRDRAIIIVNAFSSAMKVATKNNKE